MNERITRLKADFEKNENKISALQAKNKRLADKITQLENAEIIGAVRTSGFSIDELLSLLGKSEIKNDLEENDNEL
ncbi:MAG TPA: DUF4315 family protein [Candidatus Ornithomonoglobus merdipullorum]|uniref:DUF4315 family protein n=1 Tax=Candidatus Ornithomonoglobus merdipullorum TaxID=2840895 RepID=A0A9D1MAP7_9FIRM|nr:DUF4315 family protein [Candidatus Ornithomonoglobus merdipullorum]